MQEIVNERNLVFVSVWKERFVELQPYETPDVWGEVSMISTIVSEVGNGKSVKQYKLKLRNMKASYNDAKPNNDKTENEIIFPLVKEDFDIIIDCRNAIKVSEMAEIGCNASTKKDETPIVKHSIIKAPE